MRIIFTDLDGTLLDSRTYSWSAARPALNCLKRLGIPVVIATSKTRAEVEYWRTQLELEDPFIVENGGAIYIPRGYFKTRVAGAIRRNGYEILEFGASYPDLVADLTAAAKTSGCVAYGFHDMNLAEVAVRTRLPLQQACLAMQREYDEPFEILSTGTYRLLGEIEARGRHWTRGNRFYHINGGHDKSEAVRKLIAVYNATFGGVFSIGIGDSHNDARFLGAVDCSVLIRSPFTPGMRHVLPEAFVSSTPGPEGWNEVVMQLISSAVEPGALSRAAG